MPKFRQRVDKSQLQMQKRLLLAAQFNPQGEKLNSPLPINTNPERNSRTRQLFVKILQRDSMNTNPFKDFKRLQRRSNRQIVDQNLRAGPC